MAPRTLLTAIRTSSMRTATMAVGGLMPSGTSPAISGMTLASSRSPSSQLSSFLPRPARGFGGVLLVLSLSKDLSLPAAEHLSHSIYLYRKGYVLFIQERAALPKYHQQKLERIQFACGKTHPRQFFALWQVCCTRSCLYEVNKKSVDFFAYGVAMNFREGRIVLMPQQIGLFDMFQNRQKIPSGGGASKKDFCSYLQ